MRTTRRGYLAQVGGAGGVTALGFLSGCTQSGSATQERPNVRVGSKPFAEQEILGYLAYERLTAVDGIQVVDEIGYGNSRENWEAVKAGVKDLYWEYTGTAWIEHPPQHEERISDPQQLYELVERDARDQGIRMAPPASFSNEFVFAATREWSEATGVTTLSELAAHVDAGNTDIDVAINEEFYRRADGWNGVTAFYGIDQQQRSAIESGTFLVTSIGLTYELLSDGRAEVANGFGTDPQLDRESLVELEDDQEYFLPYQPAPTAHAPTVEAHPEIFEVLEPVVAALDGPTIRRLNRRVIIENRDPRSVAQSYLEDRGLES